MSSKVTVRGLTAWTSMFDIKKLSLLVNSSVTLETNLEVSSVTSTAVSYCMLHIFQFLFVNVFNAQFHERHQMLDAHAVVKVIHYSSE